MTEQLSRSGSLRWGLAGVLFGVLVGGLSFYSRGYVDGRKSEAYHLCLNEGLAQEFEDDAKDDRQLKGFVPRQAYITGFRIMTADNSLLEDVLQPADESADEDQLQDILQQLHSTVYSGAPQRDLPAKLQDYLLQLRSTMLRKVYLSDKLPHPNYFSPFLRAKLKGIAARSYVDSFCIKNPESNWGRDPADDSQWW